MILSRDSLPYCNNYTFFLSARTFQVISVTIIEMGCTDQQHRIQAVVLGNNIRSGPKASDEIRNKVPDPESNSCDVNVLKLAVPVIFKIIGMFWAAGNVAKVQNVGEANNQAAAGSVTTAPAPAMVLSSLLVILLSIVSSSSSSSSMIDYQSHVNARVDLVGWIEDDYLNMADHVFEIKNAEEFHQMKTLKTVSILELQTRRKESNKMNFRALAVSSHSVVRS
jgi:hypothetical protein